VTLTASLHKRLSPVFALDADLVVPPGVTIVFGRSGSGKSTLLRCLSGLTRPDAGRVQIGPRVVFDAAARIDEPVARRHVGYVFQHLALFPHMTVDENLRYGLRALPRADATARVTAVAESFHIAGLLHRRPGDMSGGERQRTALARALVTDPAVLLLDEPLSALDHRIQSRIIDDLRQWNRARGIPILYVTHGLREAFALGERVIVFEDGRIVASGTPQDVLDAPATELLAQSAGFENYFDARVRALSPEAGSMRCRLDETPAGAEVDLEAPLVAGARVGDHVRLALRAGDVLVAVEEPRGLSARNVLAGTVGAVRHVGATVVVEVDAGVRFETHVTAGAEVALGLVQGRRVWLVIKTYSCRPVARQPDAGPGGEARSWDT
jgi:molybdate transport system ATP-binding protein